MKWKGLHSSLLRKLVSKLNLEIGSSTSVCVCVYSDERGIVKGERGSTKQDS